MKRFIIILSFNNVGVGKLNTANNDRHCGLDLLFRVVNFFLRTDLHKLQSKEVTSNLSLVSRAWTSISWPWISQASCSTVSITPTGILSAMNRQAKSILMISSLHTTPFSQLLLPSRRSVSTPKRIIEYIHILLFSLFLCGYLLPSIVHLFWYIFILFRALKLSQSNLLLEKSASWGILNLPFPHWSISLNSTGTTRENQPQAGLFLTSWWT